MTEDFEHCSTPSLLFCCCNTIHFTGDKLWLKPTTLQSSKMATENPEHQQQTYGKSSGYRCIGELWTIFLARLGDWRNCQSDLSSCRIWDFEPKHVLTCFNHFFQGTETWRLGNEPWKLDATQRNMGCHLQKMWINRYLYKEKQKCWADSQDCWFASHPFCFKTIFKNPMFEYMFDALNLWEYCLCYSLLLFLL